MNKAIHREPHKAKDELKALRKLGLARREASLRATVAKLVRIKRLTGLPEGSP